MADELPDKPKRTSMFLGRNALRNLAATASRRRIQEFIDWATKEWGAPTEAERGKADEIWSAR